MADCCADPVGHALFGVWNQQNVPLGLTYFDPVLPELKHISSVNVLPAKTQNLYQRLPKVLNK